MSLIRCWSLEETSCFRLCDAARPPFCSCAVAENLNFVKQWQFFRKWITPIIVGLIWNKMSYEACDLFRQMLQNRTTPNSHVMVSRRGGCGKLIQYRLSVVNCTWRNVRGLRRWICWTWIHFGSSSRGFNVVECYHGLLYSMLLNSCWAYMGMDRDTQLRWEARSWSKTTFRIGLSLNCA